MARQRLIRASELGEYVFCQRAWWLRHVCRQEPEGQARRERGTILHQQHGRRVWFSHLLLLVSAALLLIAGLIWLL